MEETKIIKLYNNIIDLWSAEYSYAKWKERLCDINVYW